MADASTAHPGATILTAGWKAPTGLCDCCRLRPATRWFGDTSVALCSSSSCWDSNVEKWAAETGPADMATEPGYLSDSARARS